MNISSLYKYLVCTNLHFRCIVYHLETRMRKDVCFTVIALTWVLSAILASPLAIFREYGSFTLEPGHTIQVYAVTHLQHHVSESNICTDRSPHFPPHSFPLIFLVLLTSLTLPPLSSHPSFLLFFPYIRSSPNSCFPPYSCCS